MTRDEAIKFIEAGRAQGIPDEELTAEIKKRRASRPLGEYGPGGQLYPSGTGNIPGGYEQVGMLEQAAQNPAGFAARQALPVAGAVLGGMAGRAALGPYVTRPLGAAIGEAVGVFGGTKASGASTGDAVMAGLTSGAAGGTVEGGMNLAARITGGTTSMPGSVIRKTMKLSTKDQAKIMFRAPKGMPELDIGRGTLEKIAEAQSSISPGRLTKTNILRSAENAKVNVPITGLQGAIIDGYMEAGTAVGRANTQAMAHLETLERGLARKFPTGSMTPSEADAQLRAFQRDADMAAARNNPFLAQTYRKLKDALRNSFFSAVDAAVPGSNIAKATAEAKQYLDAVDTLESFVRDKTPETFVRSLFSGEEGAQSAITALRNFEAQTGTGGSIEREIKNLAMKRAWTEEEVGRGFSLWRFVEKAIAKPLTKGLIISHKPTGVLAAAGTAMAMTPESRKQQIQAFEDAMRSRPNP